MAITMFITSQLHQTRRYQNGTMRLYMHLAVSSNCFFLRKSFRSVGVELLVSKNVELAHEEQNDVCIHINHKNQCEKELLTVFLFYFSDCLPYKNFYVHACHRRF